MKNTLGLSILTCSLLAMPLIATASPSGVEITGSMDAVKALVDAQAATNHLTLIGEATSRLVQADRAEVTVAIRVQSSRLSLALAAVNKIEDRIIEYAKDDMKLPETAIAQQSFLHYANEKANKSDNPAEVIKKLQVTFSSADQLIRFASFLEKSKDSVQIEAIETYYAEEAALKTEVVAAAFADLKARKQLYETQLEVKLKLVKAGEYKIQGINNNNTPLDNPAVISPVSSSFSKSSDSTSIRNRYANASGLEYGFGEIAFHCTVPATFTLVIQ